MPLSINVGLSRKASRDYQSTGVSINVTAELDQSLLAKPDNLYAQAESALEQQANNMSRHEPTPRSDYQDRRPARANGNNGHGNGDQNYANGGGNGYRRPNGNGHGNNGSLATQSQRRAIDAIARRVNIDPVLEARDVIGAELDGLTVRQASELIDHLKAIQPANRR
jgi:hypothetical protein